MAEVVKMPLVGVGRILFESMETFCHWKFKKNITEIYMFYNLFIVEKSYKISYKTNKFYWVFDKSFKEKIIRYLHILVQFGESYVWRLDMYKKSLWIFLIFLVWCFESKMFWYSKLYTTYSYHQNHYQLVDIDF